MKIKSKKLKRKIREQKQHEAWEKKEVERINFEGPNGIGLNTKDDEYLIHHWDDSLDYFTKSNLK